MSYPPPDCVVCDDTLWVPYAWGSRRCEACEDWYADPKPKKKPKPKPTKRPKRKPAAARRQSQRTSPQ